VSQIEVTVARVVGFQICGKAGGVEPRVVPVEQCAADAVVLPLRPHGQEREIVVRVKRMVRLKQRVELAGAVERRSGRLLQPVFIVGRRRDQRREREPQRDTGQFAGVGSAFA
jgi:hypothetical protein